MFLPVFLCFALVAIDRITKMIVSSNMEINTSLTVINNFFYITYVENDGAAFSMLKGARWFFIVFTVFILVGAVIYYIKMPKTKYYKLTRLSILLIISGALGNLIDRAMFGKVIDMLHFVFGSYSFAVFNFADICVCCGAGLLAFVMIFLAKSDTSIEEK